MRPIYIDGVFRTRLVLTPVKTDTVVVGDTAYHLSTFLEEEHEDELD